MVCLLSDNYTSSDLQGKKIEFDLSSFGILKLEFQFWFSAERQVTYKPSILGVQITRISGTILGLFGLLKTHVELSNQ